MPPPNSFDPRPKLIAYLRGVVPCPSDDPFTQADYERSLAEWVAKPPYERDAYGFASALAQLTSTEGIERGWPA